MIRAILLVFAFAFAVAALVAGLRAAHRWHEASMIQPDPKWPPDPTGTLPFRPVDPILAQMGDTVAINEAIQVSGMLNASAAWWTKAAVILGFAAALSGIAASI
jgi:hypothetical protein